jgi:hypothetical protein
MQYSINFHHTFTVEDDDTEVYRNLMPEPINITLDEATTIPVVGDYVRIRENQEEIWGKVQDRFFSYEGDTCMVEILIKTDHVSRALDLHRQALAERP